MVEDVRYVTKNNPDSGIPYTVLQIKVSGVWQDVPTVTE